MRILIGYKKQEGPEANDWTIVCEEHRDSVSPDAPANNDAVFEDDYATNEGANCSECGKILLLPLY